MFPRQYPETFSLNKKYKTWEMACFNHSLVPILADPRGLVVLWAVGVGRVVEGAVAAADGAAAALLER
jgi:hypothetical protein